MALLQAPERRRRAQENPHLGEADGTSADGDDSTAGDGKGESSGAADTLGVGGGGRLVKKGSGRLKASASEPAGLGSSLGRKSSLQSLVSRRHVAVTSESLETAGLAAPWDESHPCRHWGVAGCRCCAGPIFGMQRARPGPADESSQSDRLGYIPWGRQCPC